MIDKGIDYIEKENYDSAILCFNEILDVEPQIVQAWNNKGFAYLFKALFENVNKNILEEYYEEAIRCFDKSIKIESNKWSWYFKGITCNSFGIFYIDKKNNYEAIKCFEDSIECFDRALEIDPKWEKVHEERMKPINNLRIARNG